MKASILGLIFGLTLTGTAQAAPQLMSFDVSPFVVLQSGSIATVKVTVSEACPVGGCSVAMYSERQSLLPMPASITIPAGATSASASMLVGDVTSTAYFQTIASMNGVYKYNAIWVEPKIVGPVLTGATASASVYSGQNFSMSISLSEACPAEGCNLSLYSSYQQVIALPYNYMINAGNSNAVISVKAGSVQYASTASISVSYKNKSYYFYPYIFPVIAANSDGTYTMWAYGSSSRTGTGSVTKSQNISQAKSNMEYHYTAFVSKQCQAAIPGGVTVKVGSPIGKGEFRNANGLLQYEYTQKVTCKRQ